ncbi:MAG: glycosyltransferase family 2 protein [Lachnospiraceae bacterium]|nr:glycosyltransferase family 2 protein [Lachnospiraceae bacterium]
MTKRLIIIPAYNEAGNIIRTVEDIRENAKSFDYVIVNDCSDDDTMRICEKMGYNCLNLPIRSGIGAAVQAGYLYAKRYGYECAIQIDGDGQHDVTFLEEMADELEKGKVQMVIGSRFIEKQGYQSSIWRRMGISWFTFWIFLLTGARITDPTSGMRMVGRDVINFFAEEYPKDYPEPETAVTLLQLGYAIGEIPVRMKQRKSGESSISPGRAIYYMTKVTIACLMARLGYKRFFVPYKEIQ